MKLNNPNHKSYYSFFIDIYYLLLAFYKKYLDLAHVKILNNLIYRQKRYF